MKCLAMVAAKGTTTMTITLPQQSGVGTTTEFAAAVGSTKRQMSGGETAPVMVRKTRTATSLRSVDGTATRTAASLRSVDGTAGGSIS